MSLADDILDTASLDWIAVHGLWLWPTDDDDGVDNRGTAAKQHNRRLMYPR